MVKLTKRVVDTLKATDKEQVVWDDELRGFGIRIKPTGVKSYIVQYRNAGGRSKRKTLGRHGEITPDQARKLAAEVRHEVSKGGDPVAARAAWKAEPTVDDLMTEYVTSHVEVHNKPTTQAEVKRLVDRRIRPALGKLKVKEVTRQDIAKLHRNMRETPRQANFVLSVISKAFNLAEVWGYRNDGTNPVNKLQRYKENIRNRPIPDADLEKIGVVFRAAELDGSVSAGLINFFRLLALTGCRLSELLSLTWAEIDFERGVLNLKDAKAGARSHVTSTIALDLLASMERVPGSEFVFTSGSGTTPFDKSNAERAWRKLRKRAGLEDLRIHDLRHMVGTMAGSSGANAFQIRDLLGHKTIAVTGRYVARDDNPIREIQDRISTHVAQGLSAKIQ
ncbi:tyrosine-type recombinase/integrase [Martelella endophytica]|uniref:Tyr recombinase domain-containing protein n=1 Tax=Martelella endophytica TaxID=1486262 RepID=A0A0D5LVV9_MAREN|nr:site-specific integrase [Martelella endophytica]AJY48166.1 hypothetical protein TM49_12155 [Martelella endophytica]